MLNIKKIVVFIIFALILILPGCSKKSDITMQVKAQPEKQQTEVDKIKQSGKIVLGTSADWPPSEFHKEIDGKDTIVGSDISIAQEIAKDLGVQLEIKDMRFDGLLAALQAGTVDFVLSGMAPTEERKQSVDFSDIYHKGDQGIIIKTADKNQIKNLADLKGKKIGVQKGSMQVKIAKTQIENPDLKELGKVSDLVLALKTGKVDAVLCGVEVAKAYAKNNDDISLMDVKLKAEAEGAAVAFKKGNPNLIAEINKTIKRLTETNTIEEFIAEAQKLAE
ncbi:transporter substrate-binding domain-containing protein [Clostridium swellfunianum]|uniref:transporter substrate-binding domain-containing protein n=1 Tax=Clostridium swellfunianum TaxID=1367462 RepID=UPI0020300927|nr:transporter substrate-binding domain-containing protein [Clostridium swellfunianum]MCM0648258.1 transporter substrate-binding domain-containing protein [Clostridium swellfunianum]